MSTNNTEIRFLRESMDYGPMPHGAKSGEPTVSLKLSASEQQAEKISSLEGLFGNYGWKSKLQSGFARLRVHGSDPLSDTHTESLQAMYNIISPRFVDIELTERDITQRPPRTVQNMTDTYVIFVPLDRSYDDDAFEFFTDQSRSHGNIEFLFKIDSLSDVSEVADISRDYKLYDSDVWLYPNGTKYHTVAENYDICVEAGKSNTWNVSPREDIHLTYETDDEG